jgi:putative aldouronate transport system substrate-binding protein
MIKKHKKHLALLLAAVMSVSLLAACGGSDDGATTTPDQTTPATEVASTPAPTEMESTGTGAVTDVGEGGEGGVVFNDAGNATVAGYTFSPDNPRTISMWIVTSAAAPNPDNKILKKMQDELGVTINAELTPSGDMETRIGTMLAGGDYPDIIAQTKQEGEMIKGGSMIRLDDLIFNGNYPLLAEHVRPFLSKMTWRGGDVPDGLYIISNYNRYYGGNSELDTSNANAFYIQKAVLEYFDYPDLSNMTLDKYFGMIRDYKAAFPDIDGVPTVGFLLDTANWWATANMPGVLQGSPNNGDVVIDVNNNHEPHFFIDDQYAYQTWKYLNAMFNEGLIDPESFSLTQDQFDAKVASGAVLGTFLQTWMHGGAKNALRSEGRDDRLWVATMPTFDGITPYYAWFPTLNVQQGMGVSVDADDPAEILAFLEVMMTEKWQKILFWGIEGEDYLVDADGFFYRTQEMRDNQADIIWQASNQARAFRDQLPKHQGFWPDGNADSAGNQLLEFQASLSDYDRNFLEAYGYEIWSDFVNGTSVPPEPGYYPAWQRTQTEEGQLASVQMGSLGQEYVPQLIMGDPANFDAVWDEFVAKLELVDREAVLADYKAWIALHGTQYR